MWKNRSSHWRRGRICTVRARNAGPAVNSACRLLHALGFSITQPVKLLSNQGWRFLAPSFERTPNRTIFVDQNDFGCRVDAVGRTKIGADHQRERQIQIAALLENGFGFIEHAEAEPVNRRRLADRLGE